MGAHAQRKDPIWATGGHGGSGPTKPSDPPPLPAAVVEAKERLRQAEANFYAARAAYDAAVAQFARRR